MLKVDLAKLAREGRREIEVEIPADSTFWEGTGLRPSGPLDVRLVAQLAMDDIVVRGHFRGTLEMECRRCLAELELDVEEEVGWLFRPAAEIEETDDEVYAIPESAGELDLGRPLREHVLLAVPRFTVCRETCRGLCARCGADLNEGSCDCGGDEPDDRWGPLLRLKQET